MPAAPVPDYMAQIPVAPPVEQSFSQQALAAGLGTGGLAPAAPVPQVDYMSQIPVAPPVEQYMPSNYQFPGVQGVIDAARGAYAAMPRTRWR